MKRNDIKLKFKFQITPQDLLSIFLLLACYPLAQFLPPECGWENGLIENAQAILLLIGAMFCFNCAYYYFKGMGFTVGLLYLDMFMRELSWGRVFFPTGIYTEMGPEFISMNSIPQHNFINAVIGAVIAVILYGFYKFMPWKKLIFEIKFPIISAVIGIIALILQYGGEHVWFSALTHPQNQILEELAEVIVYLEMLNITQYYGFEYLKYVKK